MNILAARARVGERKNKRAAKSIPAPSKRGKKEEKKINKKIDR